ncbi:hypothetical protein Bca52824_086553 [Brassica carinata]|uniref:NYN domain-containing protein n=1 Tax=Brassica carinata TaxID=52824 RepID=A0A8X7P915_BRACI|nr:hypothetical protein Bca52824_086553 [Brassica carinata]
MIVRIERDKSQTRIESSKNSSIKASINRVGMIIVDIFFYSKIFKTTVVTNRIQLSPDFQYIDFTHPFDYKRRNTIGIWDSENCPVPESFTTLAHHEHSHTKHRKRGDAYLDSLSSVELFHEVKIGNEEDTSDKRLIVEMRTRMEQHLEKYNEPGNILLMTGDIDFLGVIREAKRLGFYVLLAYNEKKNVRSELKWASDKPVQWFKLVEVGSSNSSGQLSGLVVDTRRKHRFDTNWEAIAKVLIRVEILLMDEDNKH